MVSLVGFVQLLGQHDRADLAAEHPGPLQGDQAGLLHRPQLVEHRLDPWAGVDRHRHQRQVLGQAEQSVRSQVVLEAEALDAAQQDAGGDLALLEQVQLCVGEEPPVHALPLTEVGGELETVLVHSSHPDVLAECGSGDAGRQADRQVRDQMPDLAVLAEPLGLEHPGRERRVGADGRRPRQQCFLPAEGKPGQQPEHNRPGQIHDQRAVRERAAEPGRHRPVDEEPQDGSDPSEHDHAGPHHGIHTRTRTRRTSAVATWIAA